MPALRFKRPSRRTLFKLLVLAPFFILVSAALVILVSFKGPILPLQSIPDGIIDVHTHTAGIGAGGSGCFVSEPLRKNFRFDIYLAAFGVTMETLEQEGDAVILKNISKKAAACSNLKAVVVLAMDGVVHNGKLNLDATEIYIPNDFLARETAKYDNLLFGASINPYRHDWLEQLQKVTDQGAVLIKWLPSIQHIDPADPKLIPFYQELARLQLPLLSHTGDEHSFTHARNEFADPKRLELPLKEGVTVIAAHAATNGQNEGEPNFDRLVSLMKAYPNLYADFSSLTQINKYDHLAKALGHPVVRERLVYGSDFPLGETPLVSPWHHPQRLTPAQMLALSRIDDIWTQDLHLKHLLGTPTEAFLRSSRLLRISAEQTRPKE